VVYAAYETCSQYKVYNRPTVFLLPLTRCYFTYRSHSLSYECKCERGLLIRAQCACDTVNTVSYAKSINQSRQYVVSENQCLPFGRMDAGALNDHWRNDHRIC